MALVARAEIELDVACERAFDALADHTSWPRWMPPTFAPVGPSQGVLQVGQRPRARVDRLPFPSTLEVTKVDRPRELTWCGGVRGVLFAEHSFFFEPHGTVTRVRSHETWSGVLAWASWPILRWRAEAVGRAQLEGLAAAVRG